MAEHSPSNAKRLSDKAQRDWHLRLKTKAVWSKTPPKSQEMETKTNLLCKKVENYQPNVPKKGFTMKKRLSNVWAKLQNGSTKLCTVEEVCENGAGGPNSSTSCSTWKFCKGNFKSLH